MVQTRHIRMLTAWMVGSMATTAAFAQKVTYNHDAAKMNQIKVMETGGGVLTPDLYYWTLHNNYKKTAANKNKLTFRTLAGIDAYNQVEFAENIDSALTSRAKIEALNLADRKVDLAWRAEGSKIETAMARFKQNIDCILPVGGSIDEQRRWTEYYNMYNSAVTATKNSFMPNAQRKKEYLRIYEDVARQNEILLRYLVRLHSKAQTQTLLSATHERTLHKESIVGEAKNRWNEAMKKKPNKKEDKKQFELSEYGKQ